MTLSCNKTKDTRIVGNRNPCIFPNRDLRSVKPDPAKNVVYLADFYLQEGCCYQRYPELLFKANSLIFETDTSLKADKPDDLERYLFALLIENPSVIMEVDGHCDKRETNKQELSLKRAQVIQDLLFARGIPRERVVVKGLSDSRPLITEKELKSVKSVTDKCMIMAKNRRINFKILSFDYGVSEADKKKQEVTSDGEE